MLNLINEWQPIEEVFNYSQGVGTTENYELPAGLHVMLSKEKPDVDAIGFITNGYRISYTKTEDSTLWIRT